MAIILDAADLLAEYLPEGLLLDDNGVRVVGDALINAQIRDALRQAERLLDVRLSPTRFASEPNIVTSGGAPLVKGVDYDAVVGRHAWIRDDHTPFKMGRSIQLAHPNVTSIQRIRGIMGETVVYREIPVRWATLHRRIGVIEWVVDSGMTVGDGEAMIGFFLWLGQQEFRRYPVLPNFFAIDYTAGLDPDTTGELPLDDIRGWVAWNAVANVASIAQQILDREGVTNQSESMDGLSRSYGVDIGKPGGRFARLLSSPSVAAMIGKDGRDFLLREIKPLVHPLRIY